MHADVQNFHVAVLENNLHQCYLDSLIRLVEVKLAGLHITASQLHVSQSAICNNEQRPPHTGEWRDRFSCLKLTLVYCLNIHLLSTYVSAFIEPHPILPSAHFKEILPIQLQLSYGLEG